MRLLSLHLDQFRNYEKLTLSFPEGTQVFFGSNAQGKTNLLEAIFLCTCARSHRTGREDELILRGRTAYRVEICFLTDQNLKENVSIEYKAASSSKLPQRSIHYNGFAVSRISDLMGLFHAIIFAPEDLQIVKNGPAERRRFLDIMISRTDRAYFRDLQDYWTILGQRNRLLKSMREKSFYASKKYRTECPPSSNAELFQESEEDHPGEKQSGLKQSGLSENPDGRTDGGVKDKLDAGTMSDDGAQLDIWDQKLAEVSSSVLKKRLEYTETLESYAALALMHLTASTEKLTVQYRGLSGIDPSLSRSGIEQVFLKRLQNSRHDDIVRGSTAHGPHRDDLALSLNGAESRIYASQGQQRSIVLALKMAELAILQNRTGEKPILLLDDVLSELDASRRRRLMDVISGHQVFITCTDVSRFTPLWNGPVHFYAVASGVVSPADEGMVLKTGVSSSLEGETAENTTNGNASTENEDLKNSVDGGAAKSNTDSKNDVLENAVADSSMAENIAAEGE